MIIKTFGIGFISIPLFGDEKKKLKAISSSYWGVSLLLNYHDGINRHNGTSSPIRYHKWRDKAFNAVDAHNTVGWQAEFDFFGN